MKISRTSLPFPAIHALALIGSLLLLPGCSKPASTATKPDDTPTASAPASAPATQNDDAPPASAGDSGGNEGQSSIAFYNYFLSFRGVSQSIFEKVQEAIAKSEEAIDRSSNDDPDWDRIVPSDSQIAKIPTLKFAAPKDFSKANQDYINPRIQTVQQDVATLLKEIDAMRSYYKAEDYKDDWHKKFLMAKPRIETLMARIAKTNKEIYKLADDISEETDRKNIEKAPDGIYILNMRDMIKKARDRADLILDNNLEDTRYGLGVPDDERQQMLAKAATICDQFDAQTKELDAMSAKYKAADTKTIAGTQAEKIYNNFFASYEKSAEDTRRILRDLRETGYTNDQRTIAEVVGTLAGAHDDFLKARQPQK